MGSSTSGLLIEYNEYIVAIDVTRVRFPAGTYFVLLGLIFVFPWSHFRVWELIFRPQELIFCPQERIFRPQELTCRLQALIFDAQEAPRRLPEPLLRLPEAPEAQNS